MPLSYPAPVSAPKGGAPALLPSVLTASLPAPASEAPFSLVAHQFLAPGTGLGPEQVLSFYVLSPKHPVNLLGWNFQPGD